MQILTPTQEAIDDYRRRCYACMKDKRIEEFSEDDEPEICCDGRECGCMGLPINPPICNECLSKFK